MTKEFRTEKDSMGEFQVPIDANYGASTARAVENFPISNLKFTRSFIRALGEIKKACAHVNLNHNLLNQEIAEAIINSSQKVIDGVNDDDFVLDIFQTGSGTSTNMNANEVIAALASQELNKEIHPNDHVNMSQSSNDVIPTATNIAAVVEIKENLIPAIDKLIVSFEEKGKLWEKVYKNGINAPENFGSDVCSEISKSLEISFQEIENHFTRQGSREEIVHLSGCLKAYAVSMFKIANDIRWMGSGPVSGLNELKLPALQPGSSIMPGKVNPVISEMMMQVSAQVIGNDNTITFSSANGNFELNTMLPVMAHNLLESISILSSSTDVFNDKLIKDLEANTDKLQENIQRNSILVTALVPQLGYDKAAEIAKEAMSSNKTIKEVLLDSNLFSSDEIDNLLDIEKLI
jgi:fumarate hydratase class II